VVAAARTAAARQPTRPRRGSAAPPQPPRFFFCFWCILSKISSIPEHAPEALVAAIRSGWSLRFGCTDRELCCSYRKRGLTVCSLFLSASGLGLAFWPLPGRGRRSALSLLSSDFEYRSPPCPVQSGQMGWHVASQTL